MQNIFSEWQQSFVKHQALLAELDVSLEAESQALMAGEVEAIRLSALNKDKALRKITLLKEQIQNLKTKTRLTLGAADSVSLEGLFLLLPREQANSLIAAQKIVLRQTHVVERKNRLNKKCLESFLGYIHGIQNIFETHRSETPKTYSSQGYTVPATKSGRFVSRSF